MVSFLLSNADVFGINAPPANVYHSKWGYWIALLLLSSELGQALLLARKEEGFFSLDSPTSPVLLRALQTLPALSCGSAELTQILPRAPTLMLSDS